MQTAFAHSSGLDSKPLWLDGFEGSTNNESIGSLVANVDGRDVPLTVGYHKVTVDIRDQIARTTIEESFVNHTDARLEGVFYFPLPQDASISGFGMWIGGELVEADIVEKQRAREIYETIKREKRDPGLLEWTGGNLFSARVFPILANSEKRIKITYTQVLPLEDGQYRYSYGLRSEMLRKTPLRELDIDVNIFSTRPLAEVKVPMLPARIDIAKHSATAALNEQDYTPKRDFEVIVTPEPTAEQITFIPHQRADNGYFLLQFQPPYQSNSNSLWSEPTREILPEGQPIRLLLLCDTSGSVGPQERARQLELVTYLLRSLKSSADANDESKRVKDPDLFNVAVCDVDTGWIFSEEAGVEPTEENIEKAIDVLQARYSLGWSDIPRAIDSALTRTRHFIDSTTNSGWIRPTHVVYIGDGVANTYDADPGRAAADIKRSYEKTFGDSFGMTCHAVSIGSSYESTVLNAIASLGGGSARSLDDVGSPAESAKELMREIVDPGLKDIKIRFDGITTARAYPERLPNLSPGRQQIVIGRYLPENFTKPATVTISGILRGEPVEYEAVISPEQLASAASGAEEENSFIPRLWARKYLDALLQEGATPMIKEEIIALSEEFHIITPYTSLLVLETDADRERFGVKRRFMMTDGERFFQQGRDNVQYELVQKYMQEAGAYRLGLRRQVLNSLVGLGRGDYSQAAAVVRQLSESRRKSSSMPVSSTSGLSNWNFEEQSGWAGNGRYSGGMGGGGGYGGGLTRAGEFMMSIGINSDAGLIGNIDLSSGSINGPMGGPVDSLFSIQDEELSLRESNLGFDSRYRGLDFKKEAEFAYPLGETKELAKQRLYAGDRMQSLGGLGDFDADYAMPEISNDLDPMFQAYSYDMPVLAAEPMMMPSRKPMSYRRGGSSYDYYDGSAMSGEIYGGRSIGFGLQQQAAQSITVGGVMPMYNFKDSGDKRSIRSDERYSSSEILPWWINQVLPSIVTWTAPQPIDRNDKDIDPAIVELADALLRTDLLQSNNGGLRINRTTESFDIRWDRLTGISQSVWLTSADRRLTRSFSDNSQTTINWCDAKQHGIFTLGMMGGSVRDTIKGENEALGFSLEGYATQSFVDAYADWKFSKRPGRDGAIIVEVTNPNNKTKYLLNIDPDMNVLLEQRTLNEDGRIVNQTSYEGFTKVRGQWFATIIKTYYRPSLPQKALDLPDMEGPIGSELKKDDPPALEISSIVTLDFEPLNNEEFTAAWDEQLAPMSDCVMMQLPLPSFREAKMAIAAGNATLEDRLVMLGYFSQTNQYDRVREQWTAAAEPIADKQAYWWIESYVLQNTQQQDAVRQRVLARIDELIKTKKPDEIVGDGDLYHRINTLRSIASLSTEEYVILHERLRPYFYAMADWCQGPKLWSQSMISYLESMRRNGDAVELARQMSELYPNDANQQATLVRTLINAGKTDEARQWIDEVCGAGSLWFPYEESNIRNAYIDSLWNKRCYEEMIAFMDEWFEQTPDLADSYMYDRYLTALIWSDCEDKAIAKMNAWIDDAKELKEQNKAMKPEIAARYDAAQRQIFGNGYNRYGGNLDLRFVKKLADASIGFARHDIEYNRCGTIITNSYFMQSDEYERVAKEIRKQLVGQMESLAPERIGQYINWLNRQGDKYLDKPLREKLVKSLIARWEKQTDAAKLSTYCNPILSLLGDKENETRRLDFMKRRWQRATDDEKQRQWADSFLDQYFAAILGLDWSPERQAEAVRLFALLQATSVELAEEAVAELAEDEKAENAENPGDADDTEDDAKIDVVKLARTSQLAARVAALHQIDNWVISSRGRQFNQSLEHQEQYTAKEVGEKLLENRQANIGELIALLDTLHDQYDGDALADWIAIERIYYASMLDDADIGTLADDCWKLLGDEPESLDTDDPGLFILQSQLKNRLLVTLMNFSLRNNASPELVDKVLGYIDSGIAKASVVEDASPDKEISEEPTIDHAFGWKMYKYQMLIGLDQPKALEAQLRKWKDVAAAPNPWRKPLAMLLAEQGELDEAVRLFEAIQADDELSPGDYSTLSNWYMAIDDRDKYESARIARYTAIDEWSLRNWISQQFERFRRTGEGVPEDLDNDTLLALRALMKKSSSPSNHTWQLRDYYELTRDYRVLLPLADGVTGRSMGTVYQTLQNLSSVTDVINEEATVNEIVMYIDERRAAIDPESPQAASDLRALDLLEMIVERRASTLENAPEPHAERALTAMQRAFDRQWNPGEGRLMAGLLYQLRQMPIDSLRDEQLHEIEVLYGREEPGTLDRLLIGMDRARLLWTYSRQNEAIDLLTIVLDEYTHAADRGGIVTNESNEAFRTYIDYIKSKSMFARAESEVLEQLELLDRQSNKQDNIIRQRTEDLLNVYVETLRRDGRISIGSCGLVEDRLEFYKEAQRRILDEINAATEPNHQSQCISILMSFYDIAQDKKIAQTKDDLRTFAIEKLVDLIELQNEQRHSVVQNVAYKVHEICGNSDAVETMVIAIENEPAWMHSSNYYYQSGWNQNGYRIAEWRSGLKVDSELEKRLLKIVLDELRRDLISMRSSNRTMYYRHHSYFWDAKAGDFLRVADEVYEQRKHSSPVGYLYRRICL